MDRDHDDKNDSNEQFCPTCAAYLPSNRSWAQHMRRNPECGAMIQKEGCDDGDSIFGDQPTPKSKQSNNSQSNQKSLNESLEPSENLKSVQKSLYESVDSVLGTVVYNKDRKMPALDHHPVTNKRKTTEDQFEIQTIEIQEESNDDCFDDDNSWLPSPSKQKEKLMEDIFNEDFLDDLRSESSDESSYHFLLEMAYDETLQKGLLSSEQTSNEPKPNVNLTLDDEEDKISSNSKNEDENEKSLFDEEILLKYLHKHNEQAKGPFQQSKFPIDMKASVQLLNMLQKAKAPLYLFDEIQKWARSTFKESENVFKGKAMKRKDVIHALDERYATKNIKPKTTRLHLPSGKEVNVVTHDFYMAIFSLLTDKQLVKEENLLLDLDEPWKPLVDNEEIIGDLHTGLLYKNGWKEYCKSDMKDVLAGLMFYIDKTHTDVQGKLPVEPVSLTISPFNLETRNKTFSWRTIGYIPNLDLIEDYNSAEEKLRDYHFILEHIFAPIYEIQNHGGLKWIFNLKGINHDVTLQMPVMLFLGDTEGQDKLVGRLASRNKVKRLCRYCNIPTSKTDDPNFKYVYTQQSHITELVKKNKKIALKEISQYNIENATHKLQYCDNIRGINGATSFEIVHTIQFGWHMYLLNAFFLQKKIRAIQRRKNTSKKAKRARESQVVEASVYSATDMEGDITALNVFDPKFSKLFDKRAKLIGKLLQQQSDRDLPRTYFSQGILPSNEKKKKKKKSLPLMSSKDAFWLY